MTAGAQCDENPRTGGALNGSVLAGRECAWSNRVVLWLRRAFPRAQICHVNSARAGSDTEVALASLASLVHPRSCEGSVSGVDLVMMDYSVNDALGGSTQGPNDLTSRSPLQGLDRTTMLGVVMEAAILALRRMAPQAMQLQLLQQIPAGFRSGALDAMRRACAFHGVALVDLNHACNSGIACEWNPPTNHPQWQSHQHIANAVAYAFRWQYEHLRCSVARSNPGGDRGVAALPAPAASHPSALCSSAQPARSRQATYRRLEWYNHSGYCLTPTASATRLPNPTATNATRPGSPRPRGPASRETAATAVLASAAVASTEAARLRSRLRIPSVESPRDRSGGADATLYAPALLSRAVVCFEPSTEISAYHPKASAARDLGGNWSLEEDRPGKPGWIAKWAGATHRFRLTFGAKPALGISYLRSYESVGNAVISLNGARDALVGTWDQPISTTQTAWFQMDSKSLGFGVAPNSTHDLELTFIGGARPGLRGVYHSFDANGEKQGLAQVGCRQGTKCMFKLIDLLAC